MGMSEEMIDTGRQATTGWERACTDEVRRLRGRVGGYNDPLPVANRPATATCEDCGEEHTTYAAYRQAHRAEDEPTEGRICLGCIARAVHTPRPTGPAALLPGTCQEIAK